MFIRIVLFLGGLLLSLIAFIGVGSLLAFTTSFAGIQDPALPVKVLLGASFAGWFYAFYGALSFANWLSRVKFEVKDEV